MSMHDDKTVDGPPIPPPDHPGLPFAPAGYAVERLVGRGGWGLVWKARHLALNRVVALKQILPGTAAEPTHRSRFRQEAELAARLQHPNIVQIYEVGDFAGCPFLAMEFVDGPNLADHLGGKPQPPREAAGLVRALAEAMQYAHEKGVVHRDLKPANVLMSADGVPKIADFGLARRLADDNRLTQSGAVVGTPSYMPPEQAAGRGTIGPQADVYSLGAILYEQLTGRPPFFEATTFETIQSVLTRDPVSPSRLQPRLPADLVTVCLKCLEKDPVRRYASAAVLAEDLRRFLAGEPIRARAVGTVERTWRWARRNPSWAAMLGTLATLLLVIAVGATVYAASLSRALARATEAEEQLTVTVGDLTKAERATQEQLFDSLVAQADTVRLSRRSGQRFRSLELVAEARDLAQRLDLSLDRQRHLRTTATSAFTLTDLMPEPLLDVGEVTYAVTTRDARLLATVGPKGELTLRRLPDARVVARVAGSGVPAWLTLHPRGEYVSATFALPNATFRAIVWRVGASGLEQVLEEPGAVGVAFQADGPLVAFGRTDLVVVNLKTRKRRVIPTAATRELAIDFHPRKPVVAVASYFARQAEVFDTDTGQRLTSIPHPEHGGQPVWSPDGRYLVVAEQTRLRLHETTTYQPVRTLPINVSGGPQTTFNALGDRLLVVGWNAYWHLFDVPTGRLLFRSEPIGMPGVWPMFTDDGTRVGLMSRQGKVGLLRYAPGDELRVLQRAADDGKAYFTNGVLVDQDRLLVVSGNPNTLIFDLDSGEEVGTLPITYTLFRDPGRGELLTGVGTRAVRIPARRSADGRTVQVGPPGPAWLPVNGNMITPDGNVWVSTRRSDGKALLWRRGAITPDVRTLANVNSLSPDGRWVACVTPGSGVTDIVDVETAKTHVRLPDRASHTSFSSDGKWLFLWGSPGHLYSTRTWQKVRSIEPGSGVISADSQWYARDDGTGMIHLERLESGELFGVLDPPEPGIGTTLLLTADGGRLIAIQTGLRASIYVWNLRLLRERLRERGMDEGWPTFPPATPAATQPVKLDIVGKDLGGRVDPSLITAGEKIGRRLEGFFGKKPDPPVAKSEPVEAILARLSLHLFRHPFDAAVRYQRANLLHLRSPADKRVAHADYTLAIALGHPSAAIAHHRRGHLNEQRRRWADAEEDFTAALAGLPDERGHLLACRGGSRLRLRRFDKAVADLKEALPLVRDDKAELAAVSRDYARALLLGDGEAAPYALALKLAREAVELDGGKADGQVTLGLAHYRRGEYREAVAPLTASLELANTTARGLGLVLLAGSHAKLGDTARAKKALDDAERWAQDSKALAAEVREDVERFRAEVVKLLGAP